mmetsp:Transcript_36006/g.82696  ORF Transcript_36006/g.82696 Transcript_36006/m.82696 type:complete len:189 (+) Transcript_36006:75-641(+)
MPDDGCSDEALLRKHQQGLNEKIFDAAILNDIDAMIDKRLNAEILDEVGPEARKYLQVEDHGNEDVKFSQKYCRHVLRGKDCPFGMQCRFRHFAANPSGQRCGTDEVERKGSAEREVLTCRLCHCLLQEPVTLRCGHSFDRNCLLAQKQPLRCPIDGSIVEGPLPEVDFVIRAYIGLRFRCPTAVHDS